MNTMELVYNHIHNAPNIVSPLQKGRSPLLVACMGGHEGTVKVLLERKAQVDLQNEVRCEMTQLNTTFHE